MKHSRKKEKNPVFPKILSFYAGMWYNVKKPVWALPVGCSSLISLKED